MAYDPFNPENQNSSSRVPAWLWLVGGVGLFLACCVGSLVVSFMYLDQNMAELMGGFPATVEAGVSAALATATPSPLDATPEPLSAQPTQPSGMAEILATRDALLTAVPDPNGSPNDVFATAQAILTTMPDLVGTAAPSMETDNIFATAQAMLTGVPDLIGTPVPFLGTYEPYTESFARAGDWDTGQATAEDDSIEAEADATGGVFDFNVYVPKTLFWSTAKQRLGPGTYQIEATAVSGTLNNGYGLLLLGDNEADDYYMFEISSDGYVWIGFYGAGGETVIPLVNDGWFASDAVIQGLNQTNVLRAEIAVGSLRFFVNDEEVATVRDFKLLEGDVGVFVETLDEGNVRIHFDNLSYTPAE